jgi:hypothetical protein
MERDRDHLGCRLEIVESSAASLEIGNAAPLPISAHLDLIPLGQADGALTASVACRPGLYGKVGRRIDDDFCALQGQAVLACCKFGPGAGYVEIDMRSTMQPILRALAAGVFHHIVAFRCRHINYCSRGYKVARVASRDSGWSQIVDPASGNTGWVESNVLVPSPTPEIVAAEESTGEAPDATLDTPLEDQSSQISRKAHSATKSRLAAKAKHHRNYGRRRFAFRFFFRGFLR